MSKNYKNTMDKITVDEDMKKRILTNINNISNEKEINCNKKYIHKHYKKIGLIAACCTIIIFLFSRKIILGPSNLNNLSNSSNLTESSESSESSENAKITLNEYKENDNNKLQSNKTIKEVNHDDDNSPKVTNESVNNDKLSSNHVTNNDSSNNSISKDINKNNHVDTAKNVQATNDTNNNETKDENTTNTKLNVELAYANDNSKIRTFADESKPSDRKFENLDELKNSLDFNIKTPKDESNEEDIKSISMDSSEKILIEYKNKDYSLGFKIEKEADDENSLEDIKYETEKIIKINENDVLLKGNNNLINSAKWNEDKISYSINSPSGINEENVINIIENVK